jgi:hypothetical protein
MRSFAFGAVLLGACSARVEDVGFHELAVDAFCDVEVVGIGSVEAETDYLPHVIQCENGGADLEALKAQAVAARSYMYYKMETSGSIADGTSDQVYSCGAEPLPIHHQAVEETSGLVLRYADVTVCAFYVAGADPSDRGTCVSVAGDSDPTNTEQWVTYNDGRSGDSVIQTPLGWVDPGNFRNRGCHSQWGARCLDERGDPYDDILRFYYGDDIGIERAVGPCVEDEPPPPECEPVAETCNCVDDDCNDLVDDGEGACPWVSRALEASVPDRIEQGAIVGGWATFRNEGSMPWAVDEVAPGVEGDASLFATTLALEGDVAPGDPVRVEFELEAAPDAEPGPRGFVLRMARLGEEVAPPCDGEAGFELRVEVVEPGAGGDADADADVAAEGEAGCSCGASGGGAATASSVMLALAIALSTRRRVQ